MDALGAREAYLYGYYGIPDKLLTGYEAFHTDLTEAQQQAIYEIGQRARDRQLEAQWQKAQEKRNAADVTEAADFVGVKEEIIPPNEDLAVENHGEDGTISIEASALPDRFKKYVPNLKRRREIIAEGIELQRPIFDRGRLGILAKGLPPYEDYYDVVLHGSKYGFQYFGEPIDVETLCAIIAQRKDYKKGTNIRLIACNSGTAVDGVARYMANKLHVTVLAPDNKAIIQRLITGQTIVYAGSEIGAHDGEFIPFTPDDEVNKK